MDGKYKGVFHGVHLALKDNIYFANEVTTMASKIHKDFVSKDDATVATKLRDAGVIFTGKLNMHEYALGLSTTTTRTLVPSTTPGMPTVCRVAPAVDQVPPWPPTVPTTPWVLIPPVHPYPIGRLAVSSA